MYINEEEWSFEKGTVITKIELDFDPLKYKTKAGAAKAFYKAICKLAKEFYGHDPAYEVHITSPKETAEHGYGECWRVSWEAGPFEWAIGASFQVCNYEAGWYTEPYYSFDLCFAE